MVLQNTSAKGTCEVAESEKRQTKCEKVEDYDCSNKKKTHICKVERTGERNINEWGSKNKI